MGTSGIIRDLKKTNKANLLHRIEGNALPQEHIPAKSTRIFDGTVEVRSFKATGLTFGELADKLFRSIISKGSSFWCFSGDLNKVSEKDQRKKECCDNISLDHTNAQNQTMEVIFIEFQEQNCSYKVFGQTMDGKWLLDFATQQIYLHIASKWLFYVPRWHLVNCWYSHLLWWGGWQVDVTSCKTSEGPWGFKSSNSHSWN